MKHDEHGGVLLWIVLVVIGIIIIFFVSCDALFDDEDEKNDLGWRNVKELVAV